MHVSINPNIKWDDVFNNLNLNWNWHLIASHKNITWKIIKENYIIFADYWADVSGNPNITWKIVQENSKYPWVSFSLSMNPNITFEIIEKYPNYNWHPHGLSDNPNITFEMIKKYKNIKWKWAILSRNSFEKEKSKFISKKIREHLLIRKLQRNFAFKLWNPQTKIGYKFAEKQYQKYLTLYENNISC